MPEKGRGWIHVAMNCCLGEYRPSTGKKRRKLKCFVYIVHRPIRCLKKRIGIECICRSSFRVYK
jgi:hypothetical protein